MVTIDFHTHIFSPAVTAHREHFLTRDRWFGALYANPQTRLATADHLVAALDAAGIDSAVALSFAWQDQALCRDANDYMLDAVARFPGRLIGLAVVNPIAPGAAAEIERCLHAGLAGVGELMPAGQDYSLEDHLLGDVLEQLASWKRPILIHAGEPVGHTYPGKCPGTLESFYQLAIKHPQTTLVAAHWGGGLFFYELMPEVRAALRNVYYDTAASPFLYDPQIFALAAQLVPDKILFGTDYPLIPYERFLRHINQGRLSAEQRALVLGGNAARLLSPKVDG